MCQNLSNYPTMTILQRSQITNFSADTFCNTLNVSNTRVKKLRYYHYYNCTAVKLTTQLAAFPRQYFPTNSQQCPAFRWILWNFRVFRQRVRYPDSGSELENDAFVTRKCTN